MCTADISTDFLYAKTRKNYIVTDEEFGEDAGKTLIVEGGCYGLKTSAARFQERVSEEFRKMGFRPSTAKQLLMDLKQLISFTQRVQTFL